MRGDGGMNSDKWHGGGLAVLADDRGTDGHRNPQTHLLAYCGVSGLLGTGIATVLSLAASGTTRIAIWAAALTLVSLMAGLAYGSRPLDFLLSAYHLSRRRRAGS